MKFITQFFQALSNVNDDVKKCADLAFLDYFPATTAKLSEWFSQFGITDTGTIPEDEKRAKLDGAWKATGSLSPRYLQDTLRAQGFDVYVHEWWAPGSEPPPGTKACVTPRNPHTYLSQGGNNVFPGADCGEPLMACGEAFAECGNGANALGYPLQNITVTTVQDFTALCGEPEAECGQIGIECGNYIDFEDVQQEPVIPADPAKWPYFVYVGGQNFPDLVSLPVARRDEFEALLLKYCPAHMWVGVMATYT